MNAIPNYEMPNNFLSHFFVSIYVLAIRQNTLLPGELILGNLFASKGSGAPIVNHRSTNEEFHDSVRMPRDRGRLCMPRRFFSFDRWNLWRFYAIGESSVWYESSDDFRGRRLESDDAAFAAHWTIENAINIETWIVFDSWFNGWKA